MSRTRLVNVLSAVLEQTSKGKGRRWRPRRRWVLTLACGHVDTRDVNYIKAGTKRGQNTRDVADVADPPKRVRCDVCEYAGIFGPTSYIDPDFHPVERGEQP